MANSKYLQNKRTIFNFNDDNYNIDYHKFRVGFLLYFIIFLI